MTNDDLDVLVERLDRIAIGESLPDGRRWLDKIRRDCGRAATALRDLRERREADRRLIASTNQALERALERAETAETFLACPRRRCTGRDCDCEVRVVAADPAPTDPEHEAIEVHRLVIADGGTFIGLDAVFRVMRAIGADPALDMPGPDTTEGSR